MHPDVDELGARKSGAVRVLQPPRQCEVGIRMRGRGTGDLRRLLASSFPGCLPRPRTLARHPGSAAAEPGRADAVRHADAMDMAPFELAIADDGTVTIPLSLLAQAGLNPGTVVLGISPGDGRIVLRRLVDATDDLLAGRPPS